MRVKSLHDWKLSPGEAVQLQRKLAGRVRERPLKKLPRIIAGVDCGYSKATDTMYAAVVLCRLPAGRLRRPDEVEIVEERVHAVRAAMPYVPGLLSFREAPAVLACFRKLSRRPEAVIVDGQGRAHMRRLGLASHLGIFLNVPTIGCAKSVLVGEFKMPAESAGSTAPLVHKGHIVGTVVRTRDGVRPVYVSVGHRLSLEAAVGIALMCGAGYRLPEPTRLADHLVARERASVG